MVWNAGARMHTYVVPNSTASPPAWSLLGAGAPDSSMDGLLTGSADLPPPSLGMFLDPCDTDAADDWLAGIRFTPVVPALRSASATSMPACPVSGGTSSAPVPIVARRRGGPAWESSTLPLRETPCGVGELVDSWESSQSLLASTLMDDASPSDPTAGLLAQSSVAAEPCMVPLEPARSCCHCGGLVPALGPVTQPLPLQQHSYACNYQGPVHYAGTSSGTFLAQQRDPTAYVTHQKATSCFSLAADFAPPYVHLQQAQPPFGAPTALQPTPSFTSLVRQSGWGSSSVPQLVVMEHAFYRSNRFGAADSSGMVPVGVPDHGGSHGSLTALEVSSGAAVYDPMDAEQSCLSQGSDTVLNSPVHALALRSSPTVVKGRIVRSRGLQPLKQPSRQRSSTSLRSLAAEGGSAVRPVRSAARRSLVLTGAAADLVEVAEDKSDGSVELGSADDMPSSGASGGSAGVPALTTVKKKHNAW